MSLRDRLRDLRARVAARLSAEDHRPLAPRLPDPGALLRGLVPVEEHARAMEMELRDNGHGFDRLGMSREGVSTGLALTRALDRWWFRVSGYGRQGIPGEGPVIIAANHSGTLPLDGMMIWSDLVRRASGGRVPRVVLDHFVGELPFVSTVFTRAGAIGGARGNVHEVLSHDGLLIVFPEGTRGIGKPFSERYKLQQWSDGHAELAIRHQAAIVPCAVIGAEEQMPQVARLDAVRLFGAPYIPIPATLVPLPVHYHIWYGTPIDVAGRYPREAARHPGRVSELALEVRDAVAALIEEGLAARTGVFS